MNIGYVCTNYKNSHYTREAVQSLLANKDHRYRAVVVDNDSGEEDTRALRNLADQHAEVTLILNQQNLGYFRGLNVGIKHLRANDPDVNYMVVGNNDLVFASDFADSLSRNLARFQTHAVVSPRITTLDGVHQNPHVINGIGKGREIIYDAYYLNYYLALAIRKSAHLTRRLTDRKDEAQHSVGREISQGHGSCYLLGPLFFQYFEELSAPTFLMGEEYFLSKQLEEKGLRIYYEPTISVRHHCHAAVSRLPNRAAWEMSREAHRLRRRHVRIFASTTSPRPKQESAAKTRTADSPASPISARPYRICANCVMDTTDSEIVFDDRGVCDHCNNFYTNVLPNWHADETGWALLQKKVEKIKQQGVGKDFDCIIGMSGGVDSSYLTYIAKEKLGLRPLVFHVDGGWNSQIAVNNIEKIVDGLGLDLYTEVIDWEEMRDLQLAFFKSGVPHIDIPQDHAFFATMYNFAAKYGVKYILTGANYSTECVKNPLEWIYFGTDVRQIRDIHQRYGQRPLRSFPLSNILRHKIYLRYLRRIEVVKPLDYVPYRKEDAMQLLQDKFGWQKYPQKHFESRFTKFYEGYWLPKKFGFDTRKVQFSSLILTGQMTREEALAKLALPSYDENTIARDFEYVATKLGISVDELQSCMDAPNKSFRDYKSQQVTFMLGANVMKALGLEKVVKR